MQGQVPDPHSPDPGTAVTAATSGARLGIDAPPLPIHCSQRGLVIQAAEWTVCWGEAFPKLLPEGHRGAREVKCSLH